MRTLAVTLAVVSLAAVTGTPAQAQEAADELVLTGCLAQETDEGETEFILRNISSEAIDAAEVDLVPGEDMDLSPHVGHTVEITGAIIPEAEDEMGMEEEADTEEEGEVVLQVKAMSHIAATCSEG